jgi:DNA (cytosine-5)-methyltransferase 1
MSATHFYVFIGNKKLRISKKFYNFLRKNLTKRRISFVNIFSGAGGFTTGLINAGLEPIACFDSDVIACKTLKANHPQINVLNQDIESINFLEYRNRVDVLVGGSPCQSFSEIGLKKGLSDKNGTALLKFIDIIFMIQPRLFIIENVKGLKTFEQGRVFKKLLQKLGGKNLYNVE